MQKLSYVKCSPGGNITVLVFTEVQRKRQPDVARHIMALMPDVEQVGFVEKPDNPQAAARLQMMGGEFCGNATRALAWVLTKKNWPELAPHDGNVVLEVSGAKRLLNAQITGSMVRVEMPIKHELESVRQIRDRTVVDLEGISHVIVYQSPDSDAREKADRLLAELGLQEIEAAGVLYCEPREDGIYMTPFVWVRDTATLIQETACASGTVCVALAEAAASRDTQTDLRVYQPSGGFIRAFVEIADGKFSQAFIEGPVEILEESEITLNA